MMVPPRPNYNFHSSEESATQPDNLFGGGGGGLNNWNGIIDN